MTQEWKTSKVSNKYQVSNLGGIRQTAAYDLDGIMRGGKELNPHISRYGYPRIELRVFGKKKKFHIHRLIAEVFIPNDDPERKTQVNHKDGCKTNNRVDNLEWVTRSENQSHARLTGLNPTRFTHDEVNQIRMKYVTTDISQAKLAEEFKTGKSFIGYIVTLEACKYFTLPISEQEYRRLLLEKQKTTNSRARANRVLPTKLTDDQVKNLMADWDSGRFKTKIELSKKYNVTSQYVGQLISGKFNRKNKDLYERFTE